ncbi:MAG: ribosome maturation factor RimM [Coriobacteriia bacterium]
MDAPYVTVARVIKTHGLQGEVAVKMLADLPLSALKGLRVWLVPPPDELRETAILGVRQGPKGPLLTLEGVTDLSVARGVCGTSVLVRANDVEGLIGEEEPDVVGMTISDDAHGVLGTVVDVIVTGANDVWVVRGSLGEILLPVIDDVLLEYDEDTDTMKVRLLPGLLDED